ncbi:hypothetical protein BB560_001594 [Smittium megazygosporum]|uniref:NADP-dependent oxidoreductase domain-containing protein n=1 Tax=Smittium megazygosporum TaxID=133381 RepID=A0A2T9ZH53_9FUNG|nr:hypothetical protein BB560_001596 [Smittium megazygosporum]PVV03911.1 hypothetical protein BB560_001594 [Smittium megazygosporum]
MSTKKINLSKIGIGGGAFSGFYDKAEGDIPANTIKAAFDNGINWIDTSPYYGNSESIIGDALRKLNYDRSKYYVMTKFGRYGYHKAEFNYSKQNVKKSVLSSIQKLGCGYLDFILCHDVEFVSIEQVVDEALPELFELKKSGAVKNVGVSGYPLDSLLKIAEIMNERGTPLDVVLSYSHVNIHNKHGAEIVPTLRTLNIKYAFAASPLSMGLLRQEPSPDWHPASDDLKHAVEKCKEIAKKYQFKLQEIASPAAFFIAYPYSIKNSNSNASHDSTSESRPKKQDSTGLICFDTEDENEIDGFLFGMLGESQVFEAIESFNFAKCVYGVPSGNAVDSDKIDRFKKALGEISIVLEPFKDYSWPSPPADA